MRRRLGIAAAAALAVARPALAHHGVAAVGAAGAEGPGAAIETTSPLPLPQGMLFTMAKAEYVPYERAGPGAKSYSAFNLVGLGWGMRPWLSAYVFQPFNVKDQRGMGRNAGAGDTTLMISLALKWDEGLRLVPEKESLDDLEDWHLAVSLSSTVPDGPTGARGDGGAYFAPDMQTGFGAPSARIGVAVAKQLTRDLTWLAEASHHGFLPHTYRFTRYRFGAETRLDTALVRRLHAAGRFRLDLSGELNALRLERDLRRDESGAMEPLRASGGTVMYAGAGVRASWQPLSVAVGVRRAALRSLNEGAEQQGGEGLERLRAALTVTWSNRF